MRLLVLCAGLFLAVPVAGQEPEPRIRVAVDPRIELLTVVETLADYGWSGSLSTDNTPYRRDVDAWFGSYKAHPAVKMFSELARQGFSLDTPPRLVLCFSNPPDLVLQHPPGDCGLPADPQVAAATETFRLLLSDFAVQSRFGDFWDAHADVYTAVAEQVRKGMPGDPAAELETYYGQQQSTYTVIPALLMRGNFGPRVPAVGGSFDLFAVIGTVGQSAGVPQFQSGTSLRMLLWHEFGHSFVNPNVDSNPERVAATSALFTPIAAKMQPQGYGMWSISVIEHLVRAGVARLSARYLGESAGAMEILAQRGLGFAYLPALCERLLEYEADRTSWPDYPSFAGRLFDALDQLAGRTLGPEFFVAPYAGTVNSVLSDRQRAVLVVPTAESDPEAQSAIRAYALRIRDTFFPGRPVMDDVDALAADLSGVNVVAYGTLQGNLWLARIRDQMLVKIDGDKVVAGQKQYAGDHLRLILSMPNPANPDTSGVAVYTAPDARDIAGINSVPHGGTSYTVANGTTVVGAANYKLIDGAWVLE